MSDKSEKTPREERQERAESELNDMSLSVGAWILSPISLIVFSFLNWVESEKVLFETPIGTYENNIKNKKIKRYFFAGFYERFRQYLLLSSPVLLIIFLDLSSTAVLGVRTEINMQAYGLILDSFGALIIARGLFRGLKGIQRDTEVFYATHQYGATFGIPSEVRDTYRVESLCSEIRDTIDGVYGAAFLFSGFIIQLIAVLDVI